MLIYVILTISIFFLGVSIKFGRVNIGWITLDSLLTGATITLITFSNMSPNSSPSSHIYKSIYWKTSEIGSSSKMGKFWSTVTGSFIKPFNVLILTIAATAIEAILVAINMEFEFIYFNVSFIIMLFITFALLVSTVSRYYFYNKNPARNASLYIFRVLSKKKISEDQFHEFVNLLSYLKGTRNNEFLILIIRRINKIKLGGEEYESKIIQSIDATRLDVRGDFLERYLMSYHENDESSPKFRQYKLLILIYRIICNIENVGKGFRSDYISPHLASETVITFIGNEEQEAFHSSIKKMETFTKDLKKKFDEVNNKKD